MFYDIDGTLIQTRKGGQYPVGRDDWAWWHPSVPERLKAEWESGKHIVVISNQGDGREKIRREWRAKLPLIAAKVRDSWNVKGADRKMPTGVPIRIMAALSKIDVYRKPNVGMYDVVASVYRAQGLDVDVEQSIFVGDAAGRMGSSGRRRDHSDTDLKFALNAGIRFLTPEVSLAFPLNPPFQNR